MMRDTVVLPSFNVVKAIPDVKVGHPIPRAHVSLLPRSARQLAAAVTSLTVAASFGGMQ